MFPSGRTGGDQIGLCQIVVEERPTRHADPEESYNPGSLRARDAAANRYSSIYPATVRCNPDVGPVDFFEKHDDEGVCEDVWEEKYRDIDADGSVHYTDRDCGLQSCRQFDTVSQLIHYSRQGASSRQQLQPYMRGQIVRISSIINSA